MARRTPRYTELFSHLAGVAIISITLKHYNASPDYNPSLGVALGFAAITGSLLAPTDRADQAIKRILPDAEIKLQSSDPPVE
jgi:hypothetical protein